MFDEFDDDVMRSELDTRITHIQVFTDSPTLHSMLSLLSFMVIPHQSHMQPCEVLVPASLTARSEAIIAALPTGEGLCRLFAI